MQSETGSVIHLILVAVILFAALSYAFTSSTRVSFSLIEDEARKAESTQALYKTSELKSGLKRLQLRGCDASEISLEGPPFDGSSTSANPNSPTNFSCHLFHIDGAALDHGKFAASCPDDGLLEGLQVGQSCGDIVFAGNHSGSRIYTTNNGIPSLSWGADFTTGVVSTSDGLGNTNALIALGGHPSAEYCRQMGSEWYLPSLQELSVLYSNRLALSLPISGTMYASSELNNLTAMILNLSNGGWTTVSKSATFPLTYCIRK